MSEDTRKELYKLLGFDDAENIVWLGGTAEVHHVSYGTLKEIAGLLGEGFLDSRQNYSPSVKEFLRFFEKEPDSTFFCGYLVSPDREDERFSIDSVWAAKNKENALFLKKADKLDVGAEKIYAWWD